MIGVAIKGLLGRKLRATLTAFAIVLGVAMISGAFVLTDTLGKSFDGIFNESYKSTDAVISSKAAVGSSTPNDRGAGVLGRRADRCPGPARRPSRRARSRTRRGSSTRTATRSEARTRASPSASPRVGRPEPQPDQARDRAVARAATARSRSTSPPPTEHALHGRPDRRRVRRRPRRELPDQRHRPLRLRRTRSARRRSPSSTCRRPSACSTSSASST